MRDGLFAASPRRVPEPARTAFNGVRLLLLGLAGLALLALTGLGAVFLWRIDHPSLVTVTFAQGAVYAVAAFLTVMAARAGGVEARDAEPRWLLPAVLGLGLLMRLILLPGPPVSSDVFRYVWDGRVQAAGINPYLFVPADPALAHLRDAAIFPRINRADYAPTIYPPLAQMVFFLAGRIAETVTAMKAAVVAFEALIVWGVLRLLARRGLPASLVLIYVWHPLPLWEFAASGHVDAISIGFLALALVAADRRAPVATGIALAFGAVAKFFPVAAGPALWRRWDWRMPLAFAAMVALLYAPYAFGAGAKVFGFLGQYMSEEGISEGHGVYLMLLLNQLVDVPPAVEALYVPVGLGALALFAVLVVFARPSRPDPDLGGVLALLTAFMLVVSPHLPWYFAWLLPLACLYPRPSILWLTLAAPVLYLPDGLWNAGLQSILYGPFLTLLLAETIALRRSSPLAWGDRT